MMFRPIYFTSKSGHVVRFIDDRMRVIIFERGLRLLGDVECHDDLLLHTFREGSVTVRLFSGNDYDYIERNGIKARLENKTFELMAAGRYVLVRSGTSNRLYRLNIMTMKHSIVPNSVFDLSDKGLVLYRVDNKIECKTLEEEKIELKQNSRLALDGSRVLSVEKDAFLLHKKIYFVIEENEIVARTYET